VDLKKRIKEWISKSFLKNILKRLMYGPPRGMGAGIEVYIEKPYRISNAGCIRVGDRTRIYTGATIGPVNEYAGEYFSPRIEIGSDCYFGRNLYMFCISKITVGDGSVFSEEVYISDSNHGYDPEAGLIIKQRLIHGGDISIGKSCFIGLRAAIMPGVTLGDHCVVGTGSVVTTSFPAYSMVWGSPARLIMSYDPVAKVWR